MSKTDYKSLLGNIQQQPPSGFNDHILIVDAMNTFIRSFSMLRAMNPEGQPIGGLVGFLRSIGYVTRTIQPTRVVLVFDGRASSQSRKNVDANYKAQRVNQRITNWEMYDDKAAEYASMTAQMDRLIEYLYCLPVSMISEDKVEADDVIAYIAQQNDKKNRKSTIVSSDKDFLQIVTENINVYSPIKKKFYDPFMVKQEVGMLPENYLIAKSLLGDNSDNLTGVKGLGPKTMIKEFPYLIDQPGVTLEDIYATCEERIDDKKVFAKILQYKHRVDTNYELMNLQVPVLADDQKVRILEVMREKPGMLNVGGFLHMLEQDKIEGITKNTEGWLENFRSLTQFN